MNPTKSYSNHNQTTVLTGIGKANKKNVYGGTKEILNKKNTVKGIIIPHYELYYRIKAIKPCLIQAQNRHTHQRNIIEEQLLDF